jgi:vitamin B12/bleomycin/antimicrobial peptide transport system ATP-binding/permease protein
VGLGDRGTGHVVRPPLDRVLSLPERPYLPPGTLREILAPPGGAERASDAELLRALEVVGLAGVVGTAGGLDSERDWSDLLSPGAQRLLGVARVVLARAEVVFLDRVGPTLGPDEIQRLRSALAERSITVIAGDDGDVPECDFVLELSGRGAWRWSSRA